MATTPTTTELPPQPPFQWLDRYDVLRLWHFSERQLQRYISKGIFRAYTFNGGKKYFHYSEIEAALRRNPHPASGKKE